MGVRELRTQVESEEQSESLTEAGPLKLVKSDLPPVRFGTLLAGRYQIEDRLGTGATGEVWRAWDRVVKEAVAIKIMKPELASDSSWAERFGRELRVARQIQHPAVCRVFDIDEADGHRFLTMELAVSSLRTQLRSGPKGRPWADRLSDARAAVSGLAALHQAGIIHRDIKPDNLLRMKDNRLVLSDFGLATSPKLVTQMSVMVGTPSYMAPEVNAGDTATARSDVWSLGVVLHEILFEKKPEFEHTRRGRFLLLPVGRTSPVQMALARLLADCLADRPADRPRDAADVARRMAPAEASRAPAAVQRLRRAVPRWAPGVVALAVLAAGIAVVASHVGWVPWASASSTGRVVKLVPTGEPEDWSKKSRSLARYDGKVHCLMPLPGGKSVRVIVGEPRVAEDIDVATGKREKSPLLPHTYERGCPQLSPDGKRLLFEGMDSRGRPEIRLSRDPSGLEGEAVVHGTQPHWLPRGDGLALIVDSAHAGTYSLDVSDLRLVSAPPGTPGTLYSVMVDPAGTHIVLSFFDNVSTRISVFGLPSLLLERQATIDGPVMGLSPVGERDLRLSIVAAARKRVLGELSSDFDRLTLVATASDANLLYGLAVGRDLDAYVGYNRSIDVWQVEPRVRITSNGGSANPDISRSGDVLVQSRTGDGRYVVAIYRRNQSEPQVLTKGPVDAMPSFRADGSGWTYADMSDPVHSVLTCDFATNRCAVIHSAAHTAWPVLSPDRRRLAYYSAESAAGWEATANIMVVELSSGRTQSVGAACYACPPRWSGDTTIWTMRGTRKTRQWVETDVVTKVDTGRTVGVVDSVNGPESCTYTLVRPNPLLEQRVRALTHHDSDLRVVPRIGSSD